MDLSLSPSSFPSVCIWHLALVKIVLGAASMFSVLMWLTRRQKDGYRKGKGKPPEHRSPCPFPGLPPNGAGNRVLLKFTKSMMSLKVKSGDLPFFFF
jgi:hypothetical protein